MDKGAPDDLIAMALSAPSSKKALETVYECMETYDSQNTLLSQFTELDTITSMLTVFNSEDGQSHLVYQQDHPTKAGQEVVFDLAGYLVSFNLPGQHIPDRYHIAMFHRLL